MPFAEVACGRNRRLRKACGDGFSLTNVSWSTSGDLDLPEWAKSGARLGAIGRAASWWIGDWLRYGNAKFGERYARASRITGYDTQTLMNMVYVASRFEASQRRENLTWTHHAEVAGLVPEDRERWLDRAQEESLSARCLREEIRRERRALASGPPIAGESDVVCPQCGCQFRRARRRRATEESPALADAATRSEAA